MQPRIISIHNAWNASLEIFSSNIHLSVTNIHTNASRCQWCRDVLKVITFQLRDILIRISMCLEGLGVLGPPHPCLRALCPPSTLEGRVGWLLLTRLSWIPYAFSSACLVAPPSSGTIPHAYLLLLIYQVHISEKYFSVIAKTVFKQGNKALDQAPQWEEKAKNGVK